MEIRALRTIRTDVGNLRRGGTTDKLTDPVAKSLIKRGLAELVNDEPAREAPAKPKPTETKPQGKSPAKGAEAPKGE